MHLDGVGRKLCGTVFLHTRPRTGGPGILPIPALHAVAEGVSKPLNRVRFPARAMIDWRHHPERVTAAATALLLQAALYTVLSPQHPFLPSGTSALPFVTMIMMATRPRRVLQPPPPAGAPRIRNPVIEPLVAQPIIPSAPQQRASGASVDWQAAMQHEVTTELSHASERPKVTFGFPQAPAKQDPLPAFGWDEAHIDRAQRIEHGIIDLGPCTITLAFPIPICHFGKGSANGDLFEHMHARPTGEPR